LSVPSLNQLCKVCDEADVQKAYKKSSILVRRRSNLEHKRYSASLTRRTLDKRETSRQSEGQVDWQSEYEHGVTAVV